MSRTSSPRYVCTTTMILPTTSRPIETNRRSVPTSSSTVTALGSRSTPSASEKRTPCLRRFARALIGSQAVATYVLYAYHARRQGPWAAEVIDDRGAAMSRESDRDRLQRSLKLAAPDESSSSDVICVSGSSVGPTFALTRGRARQLRGRRVQRGVSQTRHRKSYRRARMAQHGEGPPTGRSQARPPGRSLSLPALRGAEHWSIDQL